MVDMLQQLLQPKAVSELTGNYKLRIDGQIKSGKTTLALTASAQCPHPSKWDAKNPVEITDMLWIMTEPFALEYAQHNGVHVKHVLDWSDPALTIRELEPAIKALPAAAEQYRAAGVKTVVWDTLSTTNARLIRDIVGAFPEGSMDRIRAYGKVDEKHYLIFDMLSAMRMNVLSIVHLQAFIPFGEEGGKSESAQKMADAAAKQVTKVEAMNAAGMRSDFIPDMRPKPAAKWGRLSNNVLVMRPQEVVISAGKKDMKYGFVAQPSEEYSAGGRWNLKGQQDAYLRPHIEKFYGKNA